MIKKFINDMLTEKDNITFDPGRLVFLVYAIGYLILPGVAIFHGHDFNDQDWALGAAAFMAGSGVLLGLKKDSEPK